MKKLFARLLTALLIAALMMPATMAEEQTPVVDPTENVTPLENAQEDSEIAATPCENAVPEVEEDLSDEGGVEYEADLGEDEPLFESELAEDGLLFEGSEDYIRLNGESIPLDAQGQISGSTGRAIYNGSTKTIYLDGYSVSCASGVWLETNVDELKIVLSGENTVTLEGGTSRKGIVAEKLVIEADGNASLKMSIKGSVENFGIQAYSFALNSGAVDLEAGDATERSIGLSIQFDCSLEGGTLTAKAGNSPRSFALYGWPVTTGLPIYYGDNESCDEGTLENYNNLITAFSNNEGVLPKYVYIGQRKNSDQSSGGSTTDPSPATVAPAPAPAPAPAGPAITIAKTPASVKAKAAKKGKVTVSWKKIKKTKKTKALLKQIKGIEVQYSTDPTFAANTVSKMVGKKKTKVTLKLQKKTVYYVRVRYTDGAGGMSNWSTVKRVKTKK